jgi:hypothetical protein
MFKLAMTGVFAVFVLIFLTSPMALPLIAVVVAGWFLAKLIKL